MHTKLGINSNPAVIDASQMALDPSEWRVKPQHNGSYIHAAGERMGLRVDIHVAERRLGGRAFVIDAKHFTVAPLNPHELETTENYRRSMHASQAIVVTIVDTVIPHQCKGMPGAWAALVRPAIRAEL